MVGAGSRDITADWLAGLSVAPHAPCIRWRAALHGSRLMRQADDCALPALVSAAVLLARFQIDDDRLYRADG